MVALDCALFAQTPAPAASSTAPATSIKLGIARFSTQELPAGMENLSIAIPLSWVDQLNQPFFRKPDVDAAIKARWRKFSSQITDAEKKVSESIDQRDKAWLKGNMDAAARRSAENLIQTSKDALAALAASAGGIEAQIRQNMPEYQSLDVTDLKSKGLADPVDPERGPRERAAAAGADLLIWGRLYMIRSQVFAEVNIYDSFLDAQIFGDTYALDDLDLNKSGAGLFLRILPGLLGFETASIACHPEDPQARLLLTDDSGLSLGAGIGRTVWNFLKPGKYMLTADSDGAYPVLRTVNVQAGEHLELAVGVVSRVSRTVQVASVPEGAQVFDGVKYVGVTPLEMDLGQTGGILAFKYPGYSDQVLAVSELLDGAGFSRPAEKDEPAPDEDSSMGAPDVGQTGSVPDPGMSVGLVSPGAANPAVPPPPLEENSRIPAFQITLRPSLFDWKQEVEYRRDRFYDSLGIFALSVGPAVFFNALYANTVSRLGSYGYTSSLNMSEETYNSLAAQGNLYYYVGLGSALLSAVIFTDAGIKLSEYLGVVSATNGR